MEVDTKYENKVSVLYEENQSGICKWQDGNEMYKYLYVESKAGSLLSEDNP